MFRLFALVLSLFACCAAAIAAPDIALLKRQVEDSELAFARSMADRDHAAFVSHLSEDAVFFADRRTSVGRAAVALAWKPYFDGGTAPFYWRPDQVEVTPDGLLALSTGPVYDASGKPIARFNSVWRLEAPNTWRIVLDKGQPWDGPKKP
jgi:ketosteroid isomerase-like protein